MPDMKKVVLVADDEPDAIDYVRSILADEFEVVGVSNGESAIKAARTRPPALIILDVQMPKKDGFATLYDLRQDDATRSIPVVLLTGMAEHLGIRFSADRVKDYMGERPDAFIDKPVDADQLLATVRRLVKE